MTMTSDTPSTPESIAKRNVAKLRRSSYLTSPSHPTESSSLSPVAVTQDVNALEQRREEAKILMEQRRSGKWKMEPKIKEGKTQFVNGKKVIVQDDDINIDNGNNTVTRTSTTTTPKKQNSVLERASNFGSVVERKIPVHKPPPDNDDDDDNESYDSISDDDDDDDDQDGVEEVTNSIKGIMASPASQKRNSFGRPLLYSPSYSPLYIQQNGRHVVKNGKRHSNMMRELQNPLVL